MWALRGSGGTIATGWYLLPLRLFLGVTFLFAGLQKLANPDFFRSSSPISIHAQLVGAERSSPIHGLLSHLVSIAPAAGLVIALGEVAIGLGTLVGLWARVASVAGMALSLGLFLTISYHSSPYYTGSDIVFVFAWTPLALAGAAGAPALDTWFARSPASGAEHPDAVARRTVLSRGALTGVVVGVYVVLAGLVAAVGRANGDKTTQATNTLDGGGATPTTAATAATSTTGGAADTTTTAAEPSGASVGSASSVPVGGSAAFTDPATGDPALVIQQTADDFVAFDAVCPHAGCTVAYQTAARIIACPCHGSEFDAETGALLRGPATRGLTSIKVSKGANGNLYVPG